VNAARRALLAVALVATVFFIAAAPTAGNWKLPFAVALLALGGYFYAKHLDDEREAERRAQMAQYRKDWFASFERRRQMRGSAR
jgi:hypothetical protein